MKGDLPMNRHIPLRRPSRIDFEDFMRERLIRTIHRATKLDPAWSAIQTDREQKVFGALKSLKEAGRIVDFIRTGFYSFEKRIEDIDFFVVALSKGRRLWLPISCESRNPAEQVILPASYRERIRIRPNRLTEAELIRHIEDELGSALEDPSIYKPPRAPCHN